MEIVIRRPNIHDIEVWAYVHYQSWLETYPGLVPDACLAQRNVASSAANLIKVIDSAFVALDGEKVVGFIIYANVSRAFVSVRPSSEITALYILKEYQRRGIGYRLMKTALAILPQKKVALFVLKGNEVAIKFYQQVGFVFSGYKNHQEVPGGTLEELEMVLNRK